MGLTEVGRLGVVAREVLQIGYTLGALIVLDQEFAQAEDDLVDARVARMVTGDVAEIGDGHRVVAERLVALRIATAGVPVVHALAELRVDNLVLSVRDLFEILGLAEEDVCTVRIVGRHVLEDAVIATNLLVQLRGQPLPVALRIERGDRTTRTGRVGPKRPIADGRLVGRSRPARAVTIGHALACVTGGLVSPLRRSERRKQNCSRKGRSEKNLPQHVVHHVLPE